VTAEAVEQIQVQAGGFNAEYGGANAGIVQTQLRTGGADRWNASLIAESDRYTAFNKSALGGNSYGYSDFTGTIGGPGPRIRQQAPPFRQHPEYVLPRSDSPQQRRRREDRIQLYRCECHPDRSLF
jgi:hypothetical protein